MMYRISTCVWPAIRHQSLYQIWPFQTVRISRHYSTFLPHYTPILSQAEKFVDRVAIVDGLGSHTYGDLLARSCYLAQRMNDALAGSHGPDHVAFLCPNDSSYVVAQWACWQLQKVAVPLSRAHPVPQLEYFVKDSQSSLIVAVDEHADKVQPVSNALGVPLLCFTNKDIKSPDYKLQFPLGTNYSELQEKIAMILYTSGTTGPPKGVMLSHDNIHCQVSAMVKAWEWSQQDIMLHVLPLHHTHGIITALLCPLFVGACCMMLPDFNVAAVWEYLLKNNTQQAKPNMFTGVPTMYVKLIQHFNEKMASVKNTQALCERNIRVMVCGSDAVPEPVMKQWEDITGHTLLERYGMTEIGTTLSTPLHAHRVPGSVGSPLPGMEVCIAKPTDNDPNGYNLIARGNYEGTVVTPGMEKESGELLVRGPNVFKGYWDKPSATKESFTKDGWFRTGDTACVLSDGNFKILGRTSVDIIKSGGYKISALDVQRHLMVHPSISECAVVGLPDETWGARVAAVVVLKEGSQLSHDELKAWCKERMANYTIPSVLRCVQQLPRNNVGKINKKELVKTVFPEILC